MIPKRIISIWIGTEIPDLVKKCMQTYNLHGYEHVFLTEVPDEFRCEYLNDCLGAKQWVKASDFLRMAYLEKYGGIYLDADTKIVKPFNDILDKEMFVCREDNGFIANGIVGSVAHHPVLVSYLDVVQRNFKGSGDLIFEPGMELWTNVIMNRNPANQVEIYTPEYFLPFNHQTGQTNITGKTYTYHYYLKSWKK